MTQAARILKCRPEALNECARLLRRDELVAVPTETVYGLAGNALSEAAVRKIFSVKGRPLIDPLITHFKNATEAFAMVLKNKQAELLAEAYWPGPLTLVLNKTAAIPDLVTAGLSSAAVRVPAQVSMRALLQDLEFPLAAPSANPFGYVSPTQAIHVANTLGSKIGAILDGGSCEHGIESTVIDLRSPNDIRILRPGPISAEQIGSVIGKKIPSGRISSSGGAQSSPGQLSKHYSPATEIELFAHGEIPRNPLTEAALVLNRKPQKYDSEHIYWLSEDGRLETIARNLFDLLQKLDQMGYGRLQIEALPEEGIGVAVNDRLRRAAS